MSDNHGRSTTSDVDALPTSDEIKERLTGWMDRYCVPGAAVGWMCDGRTEIAATGTVNVETGANVIPDTLFQVGSITKAFTATQILQLQEKGLVSLDAPAVNYLPELRFADDALTRQILVRHLLSHTSGVDGELGAGYGRDDDCIARYVDACRSLGFMYSPGTAMSYSNTAFIVAGRIVEQLTKTTWDDALKSDVLHPLGLTHSVTLPEEALRFSTAAGHTVAPDRTISLTPVWHMERCTGPAHGLCATIPDLLSLAAMRMQGGVAPNGNRLLSQASIDQMQQVQLEQPPLPGDTQHRMGLGCALSDWGGHRVIAMNGGAIGQVSALRLLPARRFAVAVLTNSATGGLLTDRVLRWLFERIGVQPPAPVELPETPADIEIDKYVGNYDCFNGRVSIEANDGKLFVRYIEASAPSDSDDWAPLLLVPMSETVFIQQDPYLLTCTPVVFSEFEKGRPRYVWWGHMARRVD
ncbi:MAG: beta-lactamase family protein [Pseudomonadales bacterium]|nr:beta-lactamase family protein [Pseudomonadales bacterium]